MAKNYANEYPKNKKIYGNKYAKVASISSEMAKITGKPEAYFKMNPEMAWRLLKEYHKKQKKQKEQKK